MSGPAVAIVIIVIILLIIGVYYYSTLPAPAPEPVTVTPIIASDGQKAVVVQPANVPATSVAVVPVVPAPAPAVVATPASTGPKLVGCLKNSSDLILPKIAPGGQMTWEQCRTAAGKAKYFGLEFWNGDTNRKTGNCLYGDALKRREPATNCIIEDGYTIGSNFSTGVYENPA